MFRQRLTLPGGLSTWLGQELLVIVAAAAISWRAVILALVADGARTGFQRPTGTGTRQPL